MEKKEKENSQVFHSYKFINFARIAKSQLFLIKRSLIDS